MAELQTEISPVDGQISNDVAGSIRIASQTNGGDIIVTDETALSKVVLEKTGATFTGKVFRYREVIDGLSEEIANSSKGPVYRIPTVNIDDEGIIHCACDARATGYDQEPIEVVYARSFNGGKTWEKKVIGQRYSVNHGAGADNKYLNKSRVMDPSILHAGGNKIFILAGRWIEKGDNWVGSSESANAWTAALLIKSTDNGATWTQHTIGKPDCPTQEGNHITVENLPSDIRGFLGGVDAGLKHSSGKLVFAIQITQNGSGAQSGLLVSSDGGDTWRMSSSFTNTSYGNCYEPSILELPDGRIVIHTRADTAVNGKSKKRAFVTDDFGETWSLFEPLNNKIGSPYGSGGGNNCEGGTAGFTNITGRYACVASYPQVQKIAEVGGHPATSNGYGRDQITLYACNFNGTGSATPIKMVKYEGGLAPTNDGSEGSSTSGTPYGGYSSIEYKQCNDGEFLVIFYEDALGVSIMDISDCLARADLYCNPYPTSADMASEIERTCTEAGYITQVEASTIIDSKVEEGMTSSAAPIVKNLVSTEINYIGETTLGPVMVTDVCADLSSVNSDGDLIDARSGIAYPKGNTGTVKPYMGTGDETGLIIYDGKNSNGEKVYTKISNEDGVLGLSAPFTVAFEFNYSNNGEMSWPSVFRIYGSATSTGTGDWQSGCNIKREPATGSKKMVFNPFGAIFENNTTNATFVMNDDSCPGVEQGKTIHYVIAYLENGRQIHYVNGVEVNNTTATNGNGLGGLNGDLPSPGAGFRPKNSSIVPKSIVICNDPAGLKYFKIAFGNLKFYNRKLTGDEILSLYRRRKEYLQALRTDYKSGFVGSINEIVSLLSDARQAPGALNNNNDVIRNLLGVVEELPLPKHQNLVLNLTNELFKRNDKENGIKMSKDSNAISLYNYLDNGIDLYYGSDKLGSGNSLCELVGSKDADSKGIDTTDGYLYFGKNVNQAWLDISRLKISFEESWTFQLKYKLKTIPDASWTSLFVLVGKDDKTNNLDADYKTNSLRVEVGVNNPDPVVVGSPCNIYGVGISGNNQMFSIPELDTLDTLTFTYDSETKVISCYQGSVSSPQHTLTVTASCLGSIRQLLLNRGARSGRSDLTFSNTEYHAIRFWKGVSLSGDEVQATIS